MARRPWVMLCPLNYMPRNASSRVRSVADAGSLFERPIIVKMAGLVPYAKLHVQWKVQSVRGNAGKPTDYLSILQSRNARLVRYDR